MFDCHDLAHTMSKFPKVGCHRVSSNPQQMKILKIEGEHDYHYDAQRAAESSKRNGFTSLRIKTKQKQVCMLAMASS